MKFVLTFCALFIISSSTGQQKKVLQGYVKEKNTGEVLPGASVVIGSANHITNNYGFFSVQVYERDTLKLTVTHTGYFPAEITINVSSRSSNILTIELSPADVLLSEVTISKKQNKVSNEIQMSKVQISPQQIRDIPALLGEKDVLKALQLFPGVQKPREGSAALYVRGGGEDQNLIILDEAPVYNVYHLFGFFSVFNNDALSNVELIKGGFPARYGGRLSSVLDIQMRDGSKDKIKGTYGVGIISSNFTIEGPLKKEKSSFLFSGRRTYADIFLIPLTGQSVNFYDVNGKVNFELNPQNKIFFSMYAGRDGFSRKEKTGTGKENQGFNWGNQTATFRWNHIFKNGVFLNTSLIYSNYHFSVFDEATRNTKKYFLQYKSSIKDIGLKSNLDFSLGKNNRLKGGLLLTRHLFNPNAMVFTDEQIDSVKKERNNIETFEGAAFIEDVISVGSHLSMNAGVRFSSFYTKEKFYNGLEPRLSVLYKINNDLSLKGSFANMNQYIHLLSNSGIGLPTDLWVPATNLVKPQQSTQYAFGMAKDFKNENSLTIEGYYKDMQNIIAYKNGADFLLLSTDNNNGQELRPVDWENNVTSGRGWSYGAEILFKKNQGRLTGWVGYTLSWTLNQFDSLNNGKKFYARYDRRHDISIVGIYKIKENKTLSVNWVFGTGNALNVPLYEFSGGLYNPSGTGLAYQFAVNDYGERNSFRGAVYHRLDISMQFHKNKKKNRRRTWEVGLYNAYNRANPFYYYTNRTDGSDTRKLYYTALFPVIPSIKYQLKF